MDGRADGRVVIYSIDFWVFKVCAIALYVLFFQEVLNSWLKWSDIFLSIWIIDKSDVFSYFGDGNAGKTLN